MGKYVAGSIMRMLRWSSILIVKLVPSASKSLGEGDQKAELHSSDFLPSQGT